MANIKKLLQEWSRLSGDSSCLEVYKDPAELQWLRLRLRWIHLVAHKGGKCNRCGESDKSCMEFHHVDPTEKDDQISYIIMGYGGKGSYASSWERALAEVEKCELLCRNCHYLEHTVEGYTDSKSGKRKKKLLDMASQHSCIDCGESRQSILEFHHIGGKDFTLGKTESHTVDELSSELSKCEVVCKNCHKKRHANGDRWLRWGYFLEWAKSEYSGKHGLEAFMEQWGARLGECVSLGIMRSEIVTEIVSGSSYTRSSVVDFLSKLESSGWKFRRSMLVEIDLGGREYAERDWEIQRFIHARDVEDLSLTELSKRFCMSRGVVQKLVRKLVELGVISYKEEPKSFIDCDADIIRLTDLGMVSAREIAVELGLKYSTVRKRRLKLIQSGRLKEPDYGAIHRGRSSSWNKGTHKPLTAVQCEMLRLRSEGLTADEVAERVGKTGAAVRLFYSRLIKRGELESIPKEESRKNRKKER
jgi:transposase